MRDPDLCSAHSRDRVAIRDELGLARERRLVGIYGVITVGKNPALIWEAHAGPRHRRRPPAGGFDGPLRLRTGLGRSLRPPTDEVIVRDGFLPDDELDKLVAAADVVPLAMTYNGPSGIMGKALAAGVPVVTAGSKVRARELVATDAGETAELTRDALASAIERMLARDPSTPRRNTVPPATAEEFARVLLGLPA